MKAIILPDELLCDVFICLPPCDIVRLRQVSKHFRDISLDPIVWRKTYAGAPSSILRPPGPFSWQSTQYLEHTLVRSQQLSNTWTSQPAKIVSRESYTLGFDDAPIFTLVAGRWGILQEGYEIYCDDIKTGASRKVYEWSGGIEDSIQDGEILGFFFQAKHVTTIDGQRIYVFLTDRIDYPDEFLRLLEFNVNADGLSEPKAYDLIGLNPQHGPRQLQLASNGYQDQRHFHDPSPFLALRAPYDTQKCMVFDLITRGLYSLPIFNGDGLDGFHVLPASVMSRVPTLIVPTRTHLIVFRVLDVLVMSIVVVQAFVAPDSPPASSIGELRLTHQTIFFEDHLADETKENPISNPTLLRNSVVDPSTRSVNIRILYSSSTQSPANHRLSCLDLTLHESSSTEVLSICLRKERLFKSTWFSWKCTASGDGHARGILVSDLDGPSQTDLVAIRKFTIDATGETFITEFGDLSPIPVPRHIHSGWETVVFDGVEGKLHYFKYQSGVNLCSIDIA